MSALWLYYWESDVYWRQNNKHFAELAQQNGGKQLVWRNYVTVTLCIVHACENVLYAFGQKRVCGRRIVLCWYRGVVISVYRMPIWYDLSALDYMSTPARQSIQHLAQKNWVTNNSNTLISNTIRQLLQPRKAEQLDNAIKKLDTVSIAESLQNRQHAQNP